MFRAVILDIDGTLVDSNYHHTIAWDRALASQGAEVPLWRVHRHIGMGGDKLVAEIAGSEFEAEHGDAVREAESDFYGELTGEVRALDGARELLVELDARDVTVVLASSAPSDEVEHYVDLLQAKDLVAGWTTSDDVDQTKPDPDLVEAALEKAKTKEAVLIGDTTWDVEAATRAGIGAIGVLSGGFSEAELSSAGAIAVYESVMPIARDVDSALAG